MNGFQEKKKFGFAQNVRVLILIGQEKRENEVLYSLWRKEKII